MVACEADPIFLWPCPGPAISQRDPNYYDFLQPTDFLNSLRDQVVAFYVAYVRDVFPSASCTPSSSALAGTCVAPPLKTFRHCRYIRRLPHAVQRPRLHRRLQPVFASD